MLSPRPAATRSKGAASLRPYGFVFLALAAALRAEPTFYTARVAPIMEKHCVVCHGAEKQKAGLRLDSFDLLMKGAESGGVVKPGDAKASELHRRITLPHDDEEFMPSDGKPPLAADEIKVIELWLAAGASATAPLSAFPHAPLPKAQRPPAPPLAPDWRPQAAQIAALAKELGVKLVPRSALPTDGLVLRTASAPARCDDAVLAKLAPVAALIVEAELARTRISDAGLMALAKCENLRAADLTRTGVTSAGLAALTGLKKLEALNLTDTAVDDAGLPHVQALPALKRVWFFGTKITPERVPAKFAAQ